MTYRERYIQATSWTARHIAQDLMSNNGPDETVSAHDKRRLAEAEANEAFPQGCKCTEMNSGGDCDWCQVYYEHAA